jgi:hypothetical protein
MFKMLNQFNRKYKDLHRGNSSCTLVATTTTGALFDTQTGRNWKDHSALKKNK